MKVLQLTKLLLVVIGAIIVQACAVSQSTQVDNATAAELSGENLDLMFATEFPVASKEEALQKAARAYSDGDIDKSQFYLIRALQFDSTDIEILTQVGKLHVQQGNNRLAARAFGFALQQDPGHAASREGMGLLYFKAGNDEVAREHLETAVVSAPNLWRAHNALGVIADREKDFALAQSHYNIALEIRPLADSVLINRGYSKYLNGDYLAAGIDFNAVAERSNNPKAWRNLALVYGKLGLYELALETFLNVESEPDAYNETGVIAMSNGHYRDALQYLNEAVRLSPTYFTQAEKNIAEIRKTHPQAFATVQ